MTTITAHQLPEQLPGLEGLFFLGYSNPITGNIRQVAIDARKIAKRARPRG